MLLAVVVAAVCAAGFVYGTLSHDLSLPLAFGPTEITNTFRQLQYIGHSTIAIVLAVGAGLIGSYVERKRQVRPTPVNA